MSLENLEFNYIGSAWSHYKFGDETHGGNGGLSFRRASAMKECIEKYPSKKTNKHMGVKNHNVFDPRYWEDIYQKRFYMRRGH